MRNQGTSQLQEFGLECDAQNNIYFTGAFTASIDFDPGAASYILTSAGGDDAFLVKLDATGSFQWAKSWGGTGSDKALALDVDDAGNAYITGHFMGMADLDPGPAVLNYTATLHSTFITKLDASGNLVFAKVLEGGSSFGQDLQLDASLNIYIAGHFANTVDFDPGAATNNITGGHLYTLKLDNQGSFDWVAPYLTQVNDYYTSVYISLAVDIYKNVYQFGSFPTTVDFDPGAGSTQLTTSGVWDIYQLRLKQCYTATHLSASFCSSYVWNGETYTQPGTHYQVFALSPDCDSVVSLTLMQENKFSSLQASACNSYDWNGTSYSSTGIYRDTFSLPSGCDSIAELNLTILSSVQQTFQQSACGNFVWNGQTYYQTGVYRDTFTRTNGCDSIVELQLTIVPRPQPNLGADIEVCMGTSLVIHPGNFDTYLWSNGSTASTLLVSEPGLYWVAVQTGACSASDSIQVLYGNCNECTLNEETRIYPTPFRAWLTIDKNFTQCEVRMDLYNAIGQLVMKDRLVQNGKNDYFLNHLAAGMYFYVLKANGKELLKGKVLKQ